MSIQSPIILTLIIVQLCPFFDLKQKDEHRLLLCSALVLNNYFIMNVNFLQDKYDNSVTRSMNGSMDISIVGDKKAKELPVFAGGKTVKASLTLAGGECIISVSEN